MPNYIVNTQKTDGKYHEVHDTSCGHLPDSNNQRWIGPHPTCHTAVTAANNMGFSPADGCNWCSPACHKG